MTIADFRRLALALPNTEESSHMGSPDFRVGGRIFATLAAEAQGFGNLMLTPEQQSAFLADSPGLFLPVADGWGRMGITHIRLALASEDVLAGALHTAWQLRVQKNQKPARKKSSHPDPALIPVPAVAPRSKSPAGKPPTRKSTSNPK